MRLAADRLVFFLFNRGMTRSSAIQFYTSKHFTNPNARYSVKLSPAPALADLPECVRDRQRQARRHSVKRQPERDLKRSAPKHHGDHHPVRQPRVHVDDRQTKRHAAPPRHNTVQHVVQQDYRQVQKEHRPVQQERRLRVPVDDTAQHVVQQDYRQVQKERRPVQQERRLRLPVDDSARQAQVERVPTPSAPAAPKSTREDDRAQVSKLLKELLDTEIKYVTDLKSLDTFFTQRMLDLAEDPSTAILSVEQTRAIFLDTSAILDVHGHLLERLSDALDTQRSTAQQVSLLCSIILDQKDALMRPYVTYMSQFGTSAQLLARLRQSNARFNSQLEEIRSQTGLELNSLMILPVQRLPRYELFLERLQKHAPGSRRVRNACQEFNAMVQQVDASMTLTSPLQELQWDRFDGRVNLVAPNRTLICVRDVRLVSETASFWHKRVSIIDVVGVLCNDVVVFAAPQTDRQLRFHSCMSLIGARVTDLVDDGDLVDAVRLETDRQMVTVLCNGPEDKQAWLNSIREALCTADNARRLGADTPQAVENAVALDLTA